MNNIQFIPIEPNQLKILIENSVRDAFSELVAKNAKNGERSNVLSREDLLKKYKISPATLQRRMKDGTLPYYKLGHRVYFDSKIIENKLKGVKNG